MIFLDNSFLINLKRRSDRLNNFLQKYKWNINIIEAVDGRQLKYDSSSNLLYQDNILLERKLISKISGLKLGEIGCFISHYSIWKKIITINKACLIFEDDAIIVDDFNNKLSNILSSGIPDNFNILWLGIRQNYIQRKFYNENIKINKDKLINTHFYQYTNTNHNPFYPYSYIISPNACKILCDIFEYKNASFPAVDHFMCSNLKNNYICVNNDLEPFLCHAEQGGDTDIQSFNNKENNIFLQ